MKPKSTDNNLLNDQVKAYRIYKTVTFVLALAAILVTTLTICTRTNAGSRYVSSSPLALLFYIIIAIGSLFSLSASFVLKKSNKYLTSQNTLITKVVNILPIAGSLVCLFFSLFSLSDKSAGAMPIVISLTAIFAVLYHLSYSIAFPPTLRLISGYGQIIFCVVIIAQLYLDFSVELNSTAKLMLQFSLVAMMLNTISELKITIGKPSASQYMMAKSLLLCLAPTSFVMITMMQIGFPTLFSNNSYLIYSIYCFTESLKAAACLFASSLSEPAFNT